MSHQSESCEGRRKEGKERTTSIHEEMNEKEEVKEAMKKTEDKKEE